MQFHYTNWPDCGVPRDEEELLRLVRRIREYSAKNNVHKILVHCRYIFSNIN